MKILSLNLRGMGSHPKEKIHCYAHQEKKPDLFFILESKLESFDRPDAIRLWGSSEVEFVMSKVEGPSGGLLILWNKEASIWKLHSLTNITSLSKADFLLILSMFWPTPMLQIQFKTIEQYGKT